jgi:putative ABC transport system substrate-binding protein
MRNRRDPISAVLLLLLFLGLPVFAGAGEIVALKSADIQPYNEAVAGFVKSCRCSVSEIVLNETDGRDVLEKIRDADPEAVFAVGMDALNFSKAITRVPVVYSMVPHSQLLIAAQQTASGVSMYISPEKFIAAILDVFPRARKIGVIYDPRNSDAFVKAASSAAEARGAELVAKKNTKPGDLPSLIDAMKDRIDVFLMVPDVTVINPESVKYLLLFSFVNKVPVFSFSRKYVEMGAAAGLYAAPYDMGLQAGEIAQKIVAEKNGKLIRADVRKTVRVINRKIINKMGIRVRGEVLGRAEYAD